MGERARPRKAVWCRPAWPAADTRSVNHPDARKNRSPVRGSLTNSNATRTQAGWEESLFSFKSEWP